MFALINWFKPKHANWQKLTTSEGIKVLFPKYLTRKCSASESPLGQIKVTLYSGQLPETTFSTILSIRDYIPIKPAQPEDYFQDWKDEFNRTMEIAGIQKELLTESRSEGNHPRCDLLFSNPGETTFTRVSMISSGTRLIILFAVGMLQEVSGQACSDCFRSIRF